jgi:hypothetical protein
VHLRLAASGARPCLIRAAPCTAPPPPPPPAQRKEGLDREALNELLEELHSYRTYH